MCTWTLKKNVTLNVSAFTAKKYERMNDKGAIFEEMNVNANDS